MLFLFAKINRRLSALVVLIIVVAVVLIVAVILVVLLVFVVAIILIVLVVVLIIAHDINLLFYMSRIVSLVFGKLYSGIKIF